MSEDMAFFRQDESILLGDGRGGGNKERLRLAVLRIQYLSSVEGMGGLERDLLSREALYKTNLVIEHILDGPVT